jgi:hypothetical protein
MTFSIEQWQQEAQQKLQNSREWLAGFKSRDAPHLLYGFLSTMALWPVVQAAVTRPDQFGNAIGAFATVAGGVGVNLLTDQLLRWKQQAEAPAETEVEAWLQTEIARQQELRAALDALLEKFEAVPAAAAGLSDPDKQWLADTLRRELTTLGSLPRFEATLNGIGAIAQGAGSSAAAATAAGAIAISQARDVTIIHHPPPPPDLTPANLRQSYLNHVYRSCRALSLLGVDPKAAADETMSWLNLGAVYTALLTLSPEEHALFNRSDPHGERRQPALARLNREPALVLLGDPGSGKTTFVNFVAMCLAGAGLPEAEYGLDALTAPLPEDDGSDRR